MASRDTRAMLCVPGQALNLSEPQLLIHFTPQQVYKDQV